MFEELVCTADVPHALEPNLGDNRTELSTCCRDTVGGRPVTGGEDLSRNDEGGGVGAKVLEEVGETVEERKPLGVGVSFSQLVVTKACNSRVD